ncbi:PAS domain-containing protein [Undibacter mobilis]|uniref:PAS domain-containing protein n=1 Tax=Undibacter mobilis TaxID=2292256 RepID=A0A371BD92_9BRAD|nr:PAS domain-containing protein [Undibacter mobilis]RDV05321.1 PAS domain-containing protein [Undibacter mobilis]
MRRYICQQNVFHFENLLKAAADPILCGTLQKLLLAARRDLALTLSEADGADIDAYRRRRRQQPQAVDAQQFFQPNFDSSPHPYMIIDPGPGLKIVDINPAYAAATLISREAVVGKPLFEVFPDNPNDALADGVANLFESLATVVKTGEAHAMAVQRYDIRDASGTFQTRYWQPVNTPVRSPDGEIVWLLHHVEDVTQEMVARLDRSSEEA